MVEITIAKSAGFCFGVSRAVQEVYQTLEKTKNRVVTFGEIIHNAHVVKDLENKGVKVIYTLEDTSEPNVHVIIRAHGVGPRIYEEIKKRGLNFSDATCPYVKKIHKLVHEKHSNEYAIIIVGDPNHPEVQGINGWCKGLAYIVSDSRDLENMEQINKPVCVVSQTTLSKNKWDEIIKIIKDKYRDAYICNTICSATSKRQNEAIELAKQSDAMIVIGDKHSSNTQKLYELCKKYCKSTYLVDCLGKIPNEIYAACKVGITAGASTPKWMIEGVVNSLKHSKDEYV